MGSIIILTMLGFSLTAAGLVLANTATGPTSAQIGTILTSVGVVSLALLGMVALLT
jgi:hypothetical protein